MYSILITDDERIERKGVEMLIQRLHLPLEPAEAENGEVALHMLQEKPYDLLLTDIKMPFMDGLTLASEARKLYPHIVVLILSAYSDFEKAQKAIQAQVYRYLLKPVDPNEFKTVLNQCLDDIETARRLAEKHQKMEKSLDQYRIREARLRNMLEDADDHLRECVENALSDPQPLETQPDNQLIQKVLTILHEEYMNDIGLDVMARRVNLTPGYLSTLFKQQLHQTYIKYLNNYRLDQAERLLAQTEDRVSKIAEQVGLPGESYFINLFRQRFGMTPRNYRQKVRTQP